MALIGTYLYKYAAIANREIDAELIGIFAEALADLPPSRIRAGLARYLKEGDRFPWPSDLREASEL